MVESSSLCRHYETTISVCGQGALLGVYKGGGVNTKIVGRVWKRRDVAGGKARGVQLG